jgi:phosphate transport system substrate-binding protein
MSKKKFHKFLSPFVRPSIVIGAILALCTFIGFNEPVKGSFTSIWNPTDCDMILNVSIGGVPNVPSGKVTYGGSTSHAPLEKDRTGRENRMEDEIKKAFPEFNLLYVKPHKEEDNKFHYGSNTGIKMILATEIRISFSSESLNSLDAYRKKGKEEKLEERQIASDSIAFYVSEKLKFIKNPPALTMSQLKQILGGEITNWKQFTGEELPINIYTREQKDSGTVEFVKRIVLDNEEFGKLIPVTETNETTSSIEGIVANKSNGGIAFASVAEVCEQKGIQALSLKEDKDKDKNTPTTNPCDKNSKNTKQVKLQILKNGDYPKRLRRKLYVIYNPNDDFSKRAGIAYCRMLRSIEGKGIVEKAGMISY